MCSTNDLGQSSPWPSPVSRLAPVPALRLRLFELAEQCLDAEGQLVALPEQADFTLACLQVQGYSSQTARVREALRQLPAR